MGSSFGIDDVRSDISSLAATLQTKLNASPQYSSRRCIYRVPKLLRQANEEAYTPALVSIGPLHHNDERLLPMEVHKVKCLKSFLSDHRANTSGLLNSCLRKVKEKETNIRECYADPINLSSDEFCEMVLVDSAFIIQLFRKCIRGTQVVDYVDGHRCLENTAFRDVIWLEENQLPFFILDELYNAAFQTNATAPNSVPPFTEIVCTFLRDHYGMHSDVGEIEYLHLLHMVVDHRSCTTINDLTSPPPIKFHVSAASVISFVVGDSSISLNNKFDDEKGNRIKDLTSPPPTEDHHRCRLAVRDSSTSLNNKFMRIKDLSFPPATKLHEAGVKFQVIKDSSTNLLDIKFDTKKGILKMTTLSICDHFEFEFRNMVAFEQCNHKFIETRYFTDYQYFLDCLINSPEDVQLLTEAGIIQNLMGSPQHVSELINSLCIHVATSPYGRYAEIISQLQDHCKKRWPRYRATLMHTYFKHPWAVISVVYAMVLLLLTIIQVVAGIMAIPKI